MKIIIALIALMCVESDNWTYTPTLNKDEVAIIIKGLEFYSKNAECGEDITAPEAIRLKRVLDMMRKPVKAYEDETVH